MTMRIVDMTIEQLAPAALAAGVLPSELLVSLIQLAGGDTPFAPTPPDLTPTSAAAPPRQPRSPKLEPVTLDAPPTSTLSPWAASAARTASAVALPAAVDLAVVLMIVDRTGPATYPELVDAYLELLRHPRLSPQDIATAITVLAEAGYLEPDPIAGRGRRGRKARRWRIARPLLDTAARSEAGA